MLKNFDDIVEQAKNIKEKVKVSVAAAHDEHVLEAIKLALEAGFIEPILVGDEQKIRKISQEIGLSTDSQIIDEKDDAKAALIAASLVHNGKAQVLMKGLVNSSDYLRAVLDKENGLRSGSILSHLAVHDIPGESKILFLTDGGMNVAPDLNAKKAILLNALNALKALGIENPKVALLTANEKVSESMTATVDATALVKLRAEGEIPFGIIEGPVALDVALDPEAAKHKNIESKVSGDVDLFFMPNIEAGNIFSKSINYYGHAKMAGLVLGAAAPVILTSRSESIEGKFVSIAMACAIAHGTENMSLKM